MADLPDGSTRDLRRSTLRFSPRAVSCCSAAVPAVAMCSTRASWCRVAARLDLEWVPASGLGTLYAITVNRSRGGNHNVALVDLDEGVRMMSRIDGHQSLPIGTRVQARIVEQDGANVVVFVPHQEGRP